MYEFLNNAYKEGKIGFAELEKAVEKGWITEDEKNKIISGGE